VNLLAQPVIGVFLRWRHARLTLQLVLLVVAAAVVLHGLFGPQLAPRNLATVLTSIHWRGFLIVAIVAAGNVFCTACPMVLARDIGRRFFHPAIRWPRRLRAKWLGVALLVAVLFSYELFDLWGQPRATAWLVLGYFGLAIVVDTVFAGASFCKHLCPIGQFNFAASTMSPTELRIVDREMCRSCRTSDCIKGKHGPAAAVVRRASAPREGGPHAQERGHDTKNGIVQRGCELGLFLPMKVGNLDCTLCLDCVHACPHDNIALTTRTPGAELLERGRRSGIGRLSQRADVAALAVLFTFAALVSAFAMTAPASAVEQRIAAALGARSEWPALAVLFIVGLLVAPTVLLGSAGLITHGFTRTSGTLRATVLTYAHALIPIGLGVWAAHYGFHLLTGILTIVPVVQSAALDASGRALLGAPLWGWVGVQPGAVYPVQLGCVVLGAAGSIGLVHAISLRDERPRPALASAPWLAVVLLIAATALWMLSQPMEMRAVSFLG
jgi:polyferredoxin